MLQHQQVTGEEYLAQVEPAMRHLFAGINSYLEQYRRIHWPSEARNQEELAQGMKDLEAWFGGQFSLSVLCGAVLQIAATGLEVCSRNTAIPAACSSFASAETARYCVGRVVHGLPLGSLILAGRHQFAHWPHERERDEKGAGFSQFVQGVFDHLLQVHYNDPLMDLVYDLGNNFYQGTAIRADSLVLSEMGWTTDEQCLADMRDMLNCTDPGKEN